MISILFIIYYNLYIHLWPIRLSLSGNYPDIGFLKDRLYAFAVDHDTIKAISLFSDGPVNGRDLLFQCATWTPSGRRRLACIPARACCVTFHQGPIFDQSGHAFRYRQKLLHIRSNTLLLPCLSWIRLLNLFLVLLVPTTYLEKSGKPGRYLSREIFASDFI